MSRRARDAVRESYIKIYNGVVSGNSRRRRTSTLIYSAGTSPPLPPPPLPPPLLVSSFLFLPRFDHVVGLCRCRNRPQEPLIFVFITSRCDVTSWGREDGRNNLIIVSHRRGSGGGDGGGSASPLWIEPNRSACRFSSSPALSRSFRRFHSSSSHVSLRLPLTSALCAASRISSESLDTGCCLWLESIEKNDARKTTS